MHVRLYSTAFETPIRCLELDHTAERGIKSTRAASHAGDVVRAQNPSEQRLFTPVTACHISDDVAEYSSVSPASKHSLLKVDGERSEQSDRGNDK